jgi:hypothetical protein
MSGGNVMAKLKDYLIGIDSEKVEARNSEPSWRSAKYENALLAYLELIEYENADDRYRDEFEARHNMVLRSPGR